MIKGDIVTRYFNVRSENPFVLDRWSTRRPGVATCNEELTWHISDNKNYTMPSFLHSCYLVYQDFDINEKRVFRETPNYISYWLIAKRIYSQDVIIKTPASGENIKELTTLEINLVILHYPLLANRRCSAPRAKMIVFFL